MEVPDRRAWPRYVNGKRGVTMQPPAHLLKRNIQLLRDTIDYIDTHPEQHDQDDWAQPCGTVFCYAGHAALLAGVTRPGPSITRGDGTWYIDTRTLTSVTGNYFDLGEDVVSVSEFAEQQLGLNFNESDVMFSDCRTRAELRALVDAFSEGAWIDEKDNIWINGESYYVIDWLRETVLGVQS